MCFYFNIISTICTVHTVDLVVVCIVFFSSVLPLISCILFIPFVSYAYRISSIKFPGGLINFKSSKGGLIGGRGLNKGRGLFHFSRKSKKKTRKS